MTGAFGAFGVIVAVNVRLRTLPRVDRTLLAVGSRDALAQLARDIRAEGARPAALELVSAALAGLPDWCLAARVAGPPTAVDAEAQVVRRVAGDRLRTLETVESHDFWNRAATGLLAGPVTLRIGGLPDALDDLLDVVRHQLGLDERVSATPGAGTIRWTGSTTADRLHHLRRALSEREVPLTLERAPWLIRRSVGHFGAYREGVGPLVSGLRTSFDPGGTLVTAIGDRS
jgi:FAD/FMN-containing dehydrogenase